MGFKRTEGFRFTFGAPIAAKYTVLIDGKQQTKHACEIIDVSPHGMKMFSSHEIGENTNYLVQLELEFILDEVLIKAIGEIVWKKKYGGKYQYGLIFENQPGIEELIVSELKIRRKKEVSRK
ncbi:PilZ domain-containing protein [Solibacillus sp. FSL K6-4121]|uniref:PilZ domain-containing protein n=1 Tax=Solibacillus sp. FSL K6-4121 TaxID=2921505 RepID=UPI0030F4B67C